MVGGPTPLGRGRTDAPGKRKYIELIWSKDEGNTCDVQTVAMTGLDCTLVQHTFCNIGKEL